MAALDMELDGSYDTAAECRTALDKNARITFQTIQLMKDKLKDDPTLRESINNMRFL